MGCCIACTFRARYGRTAGRCRAACRGACLRREVRARPDTRPRRLQGLAARLGQRRCPGGRRCDVQHCHALVRDRRREGRACFGHQGPEGRHAAPAARIQGPLIRHASPVKDGTCTNCWRGWSRRQFQPHLLSPHRHQHRSQRCPCLRLFQLSQCLFQSRCRKLPRLSDNS